MHIVLISAPDHLEKDLLRRGQEVFLAVVDANVTAVRGAAGSDGC